MTLQQLKYIIMIAETGSITTAAQRLFIAQPSLSKAVAELEKEMGITIFNRSNRGVYLSEEGTRFLSYARQITEQAALLESEYKSAPPPNRAFAVSAQHYAFVVNAFVELVREYHDRLVLFIDTFVNGHLVIEPFAGFAGKGEHDFSTTVRFLPIESIGD